LLKLLPYLKPFKIAIIATMFLVMIRALSDLYLPTLSADMVNVGIVNEDLPYLWRVGLLMLGVAALGALSFVLAGFLSSKAAMGFGKLMREEIYTRVSSFSPQEFDLFGSASLINRTTNDIIQLQRFTMFGMRMMVIAPMLSVGSIFLSFQRDPVLAFAFVGVAPIMFLLIYLVMRKGLPLFEAMQTRLDALNRMVREGLSGMRVIRAFDRDEYEKWRFEQGNFAYRATAVRVFRILASLMPMMQLVINLTIIGIVWFAAIRIDLGYTRVGDLIAFIQYAMHVMFSFVAISRMFVMIPRASASANRIARILEVKPAIEELEGGYLAQEEGDVLSVKDRAVEARKSLEKLSDTDKKEKHLEGTETQKIREEGDNKEHQINIDSKAVPEFKKSNESSESRESPMEYPEQEETEIRENIEQENRKGTVEFKNVTFSYPGAERPVLNNINFSAYPGEVTGIIGSTGAGKSTLAKLMLRFYDVDEGSILVGGSDIREIRPKELRHQIGYVPQQAFLFSGTIMENVRYGKEDADEDEVWKALETAQAKDFVMEMNHGLYTVIAQEGKNVSGGQKQRISIARALVRKPAIYVFDDSFSAVDYRTDARLRAALFRETGKATVLVVSQRVSTVKRADRILVLDEGRIAGTGTHRELLKDCDVYREICASQLSGEDIA